MQPFVHRGYYARTFVGKGGANSSNRSNAETDMMSAELLKAIELSFSVDALEFYEDGSEILLVSLAKVMSSLVKLGKRYDMDGQRAMLGDIVERVIAEV